MAGENKAPDNRLFQLIVVLISAVVGPLTVYFVTNTDKQAPPPQQQPIATVAQATEAIPAPATPVDVPILQTPTATPPAQAGSEIREPSGVIPAGTVVLSGDFSLVVDPADVSLEGDYLRIGFRIRNNAGDTRAFKYAMNAIKVQDDGRRSYAVMFGERGKDCKKQDLNTARTIMVGAGAQVMLQSPDATDSTMWCAEDNSSVLPVYVGPLHWDAKMLLIEVDGLGPFSGFSVKVDR